MSLDVHHLAQVLQVDVLESNRMPAGLDGFYVDAERTILVRPGLDVWNYRATLAHELAHAYFRDETYDDPRIERRADQWAAQMLITPSEYAAAEEEVGTSIGALAYHLEVTPAVIRTWRDCYARARA